LTGLQTQLEAVQAELAQVLGNPDPLTGSGAGRAGASAGKSRSILCPCEGIEVELSAHIGERWEDGETNRFDDQAELLGGATTWLHRNTSWFSEYFEDVPEENPAEQERAE
jgi:hypothetical protein